MTQKVRSFFKFDWTLTIQDLILIGSCIGMLIFWWHSMEVYKIETNLAIQQNAVAVAQTTELLGAYRKQMNIDCITNEKKYDMLTEQIREYGKISKAVIEMTVVIQGMREDFAEMKSDIAKLRDRSVK